MNRGPCRVNEPAGDCRHRVLRPVTLALFTTSQGRRWQGRRTKAQWVSASRTRTPRAAFLAGGNAAGVAGRGTTIGAMGSKSKPTAESKKPGRSIKEKRAAKHQKQAEAKEVRRGWDAK